MGVLLAARSRQGPVVVLAAAVAAVFCAVYLLWQPQTLDLSAQMFRADLWDAHGWVLYNEAWYGGHTIPGYSLLYPPLGAWLGARRGTGLERAASTGLLIAAGVPEFLAATLLLLAFSSAWLQWLPASGLRSVGAEAWSWPAQLFDLLQHLLLPVLVMASGPLVMVTRFVRDAVARAASQPFAMAMAGLGLPAAVVRRRLLRHGLVPAATLVGSLLPMLVGGSIVVENAFALDGVGYLAFTATMNQEQPMLMAIVVLGSLVTLAAFILSDWLHRRVDPRVRLS